MEDFKSKTKDYFNRNQKKIKIFAKIGIHFLVVGGVVILFKKKADEINFLKDEINNLKKLLIDCNVALLNSSELHQQKDDYMCKLGSELLRKGISEGGQILASRKEFLKQNINVIY